MQLAHTRRKKIVLNEGVEKNHAYSKSPHPTSRNKTFDLLALSPALLDTARLSKGDGC